MKLRTFILLLAFAAGLAFAQNSAAAESIPAGMNQQAIAPQPQADRYQLIAYSAPSDISSMELYTRVARKKFTSDPNLYSEIKQAERSETGLIEDWRERVFKAVGTYSMPHESDLLIDSRPQSNNEIDDQSSVGRRVTRMVLKETVKFTQERLPEIDKLIRALRFEVSTDMISEEKARTGIDVEKDHEALSARNTLVKDRFLLKTGLRVPVESGKLVIASETEAIYGNVTSFFTIHLDGQYDNSLGMKYVLSRDLHLQVERQVAHTSDFVTSDTGNGKSSLNLVQLVCKF